jgi:hypothetical protein
VPLVLKVLLDGLVLKVFEVLQAKMARLVLMELPAQMALLEIRGHSVPLVLRVLLEQLVLKAF